MRALGVAITKSPDYTQTWLWLRKEEEKAKAISSHLHDAIPYTVEPNPANQIFLVCPCGFRVQVHPGDGVNIGTACPQCGESLHIYEEY